MQKIFKSLFFAYFVIRTATGQGFGYREIAVGLVIAAFVIVREKYVNTVPLMLLEFCVILYGISLSPNFAMFLGILCYDIVADKKYLGLLLIAALLPLSLPVSRLPDILLVIAICGLLSYMSSDNKLKSEQLKQSFDKERRYSYELEVSKGKLVNAAAETAHITEVKERNRIARELHDNLGHSLAGILMILQAATKLIDRDKDKSKELLHQSVTSLADALTLVKNTVYNIKPKEEFGIGYIEEMINSYTYCPVEFRYSGNFNDMAAGLLALIATNIKEALTNASKYSEATKIWITLDKNSNFIRLMVKDDGKGCAKIKDSLGLSGMKERIRNIGGSITISGEDGFSIVCVIPMKREVGEMFESSNSR